MEVMAAECKPYSVFPRKSNEYLWRDSDGITRWIADLYKYFTKKDNFPLHKGASIDQMRGLYIWLYLTKDRRNALRVLLGYILRLGFAPNFTEYALLKPQAHILLLATIYAPLRWLVYPWFWFSMRRNLIQPISEGTTNKISLLPTMYLLGEEMPTDAYIAETYCTYWHSGEDGKLIREALIKALVQYPVDDDLCTYN